jgi:hypothetical protein
LLGNKPKVRKEFWIGIQMNFYLNCHGPAAN